jgi:hypothetical protein
MEKTVIVKSYDGNLVRVPLNKKDEYLKKQNEIKRLLDSGKTKEEVLRIMNERKDNRV